MISAHLRLCGNPPLSRHTELAVKVAFGPGAAPSFIEHFRARVQPGRACPCLLSRAVEEKSARPADHCSREPNLATAMNAHSTRRSALRSPIALNNRRSTLRLLALQLGGTLLGVLLLTSGLLA